jgi:hypothetical protein
MAQTVGDLIRSSMRKVGILAPGEPIPPEDGDDARIVFSQMIDDWSLETLLIPVVSVVTKTLITGQSEYTIGIYPTSPIPANHIETARPEQILAAFIRDSAGTDHQLETIEVRTFSDLNRKTNSSRPARFYNRKGWPNNTILFESVPYASETLHMEVIQPLSEFLSTASLTTQINLPPGYEQTLIYNLAPLLAGEYGKQITNLVAMKAIEGKKKIKRNNYRKLVLKLDSALTVSRPAKGTYQINSGP